ncbi:hypothetical protein MPNT_100041 [Candidatus Methylacidithermus pantelleriae]|uniref:Uncharacterized protein n=1 Tax=Candidatus Methylacidithermus pantelleriae TaxID=2744239 RepID=A0A8J2FV84_9BACT|nr:hypothetical protein MPNT_100041 [Candidatus Methylacidithermus pantelleriae]
MGLVVLLAVKLGGFLFAYEGLKKPPQGALEKKDLG